MVIRELNMEVKLINSALQHVFHRAQQCARLGWVGALMELYMLQAVVENGETVGQRKLVFTFIRDEVKHGASGLIQASKGRSIVVRASAEGDHRIVSDNRSIGKWELALDVLQEGKEL